MNLSKYFLLLLPLQLFSQKVSPPPAAPDPKGTSATERLAGLDKRKKCEENSIVTNVNCRSVGPSVMSGRVVDIDANPDDPTIFFVAYASGGVWFTNNNGTTFSPVFDNEAMVDIGDIAVNWENSIAKDIWVGTGESNSSRSSYSGTGIYHSSNGGMTWEYKGLPESHHIGKIILSKTDHNKIWVAAIGHLYTPNKERGIFKSTDGGATWKQTLFIDENTGAIDLFSDPSNENVLYAVAWHRERKAWNLVEGGTSSGIYKSTDGGDSWNLITGPKSGFAQGENVGRIGLSIFQGDPKMIYAIVDNQNLPLDSVKKKDHLSPNDFRNMTKEQFLSLDPGKLRKYLLENNFPEKYSVNAVNEMVRSGKILPVALADYVSDANSDLFSKPIIGPEIYFSADGGATWKKVNTQQLDGLFFTYGYYFGKIWVSPADVNEIFIAGVELMKSTDGGKTFHSSNGANQHGDHHAFWIDPKRKGHLINGNDGGVNISWDDGVTWFKANTPDVGQFYSVNADMATPYNVYGGLQDNGVWCGPSDYSPDLSWYDDGAYPYKRVLGGDGMQVQVDTRDNNTVYAGYQFGYYFRVNKTTGESKQVRPEMELGEKPMRFNWQTPILLSEHNQDILYMASQKLYRSMDKGDHFTAISADLTRGGRAGDVPYGTITTLAESSMKFGLIYTGSDDGLIYVTKDGGVSWTRISDKLPQNMRVNRVIASSFVEGRVYAVLSGFQWDNFSSLLYVSEDFGATWTRIGMNLPMEPLNVMREDPVNENLLFVGSDQGLYLSFDRGKNFMRMTKGIPPVAIHDLVVQPREHDLVIGTHGRSIYIAHIAALEQVNDTIMGEAIFAFDPGSITQSISFVTIGGDEKMFPATYASLSWYCGAKTITTIELYSGDEKFLFATAKDTSEKGFNFMQEDLLVDSVNAVAFKEWIKESGKPPKAAGHGKYGLVPGEYVLKFTDEYMDVKKIKVHVLAATERSHENNIPLEPGENIPSGK
ncbi:MAG: glycosyl hydrolase [Bacteroidetes bacterium]|nr:glycosyl hydrolase [Bacteroidota bacterium]